MEKLRKLGRSDIEISPIGGVAEIALQLVSTSAAKQRVVARVAKETVIAVLAIEIVIPRAQLIQRHTGFAGLVSQQRVVARTAIQ